MGGGVRSGGRGWGSQGGCEQRIEVFVKIKKKNWLGRVGGGGGGGGQGGCERRIEVFVKIQKKKKMGWEREGERSGLGVRVDVIEELKSFWENSPKKISAGGGVGLGGGGVRVDVNEELKFLCIFKKKNGGVRGWGFLGGGGSGWMRTKN